MKTLNIELSDKDIEKYDINTKDIRFDQLIEKIKNVIAIDSLNKCHSLAKEAGVSNISMNEISAEVDAIRNAKNNS